MIVIVIIIIITTITATTILNLYSVIMIARYHLPTPRSKSSKRRGRNIDPRSTLNLIKI